MPERRLLDRQIGRNAQMFAEALAGLPSPEARYPYLRILVSLVETAHPEWASAPHKARSVVDHTVALSGGALEADEVMDILRVREEERG